METADIAAVTAPKIRFETVTLENPIVRGETQITSLSIRKPKGGELRGLNLGGIINTDATPILALIPRVTTPPLTQDEADALEAEDFATIAGTIRGFFMTTTEKQAVDAMIAEHTPKT